MAPPGKTSTASYPRATRTRFRAAYKAALEWRGEPKVVILIRVADFSGDRIPQISFRPAS